MKFRLSADKTFKKGCYCSFSLIPTILIDYSIGHKKRKITFYLFWLVLVVGMELKISNSI